ncbi:hypothetical protein Cch01nite_32700 [Cellulomonas chitinilytica]|uniref:YbaB/EbfC family DNA-binding protein n=1 Tax=Cellulomonas chitinilytica TaxID=398759 RepID=A0A919P6L3_9CELL|nr:hypothetical protein [Cellulomonas chitinilytica]GIG22546.1 hypothetical protein Cch01nite_32700 [Cellulomonas chitinilytica]
MTTPGQPLQDPAEAFALLAAWDAQSKDQVARARAVGAAVESVRVTEWSPGREVAVTLDHAGLLVDVEFTERALAASPLSLGLTITSTVRRATARLLVDVEEAVTAAVGADDPLGRSAVQHYRTSLLAASGAGERSAR